MEIEQVFQSDHTVSWFLAWIGRYDLGRKRILDTMLAATYFAGGAGAARRRQGPKCLYFTR